MTIDCSLSFWERLYQGVRVTFRLKCSPHPARRLAGLSQRERRIPRCPHPALRALMKLSQRERRIFVRKLEALAEDPWL